MDVTTGVSAQGRSVGLFKALLAASLAMLGCCVAAAWAGPVPPADERFNPAPAPPKHRASPLHLIDIAHAPQPAPASLLDASVVNGFVPMSLSGASSAGVSPLPSAVEADEPALPDPSVKAAVIPLPTPLYAALALLAIAVLARRAVLRAC